MVKLLVGTMLVDFWLIVIVFAYRMPLLTRYLPILKINVKISSQCIKESRGERVNKGKDRIHINDNADCILTLNRYFVIIQQRFESWIFRQLKDYSANKQTDNPIP